MMGRSALEAIFEGMVQEEPPALHPDAVIARLKEACASYVTGCKFSVGDLVTPRAGMNLRGEGEPHIVLEVFSTPVRILDANDPSDSCGNTFGSRLDIRTANMVGDTLVPHMGESWHFVRYTA
jgi:hypothetical protein